MIIRKKRWYDVDWYRIVMPWYWVQLYPTSYEWDNILNQLLDQYPITDISAYCCSIGPERINFKDAETYQESAVKAFGRVVPTVKTRLRIKKEVERIEKLNKEENLMNYIVKLSEKVK